MLLSDQRRNKRPHLHQVVGGVGVVGKSGFIYFSNIKTRIVVNDENGRRGFYNSIQLFLQEKVHLTPLFEL